MPTASIDGLETRYEVLGSGPAILLYSPGGFDATVEKWSTLGIYKRGRARGCWTISASSART